MRVNGAVAVTVPPEFSARTSPAWVPGVVPRVTEAVACPSALVDAVSGVTVAPGAASVNANTTVAPSTGRPVASSTADDQRLRQRLADPSGLRVALEHCDRRRISGSGEQEVAAATAACEQCCECDQSHGRRESQHEHSGASVGQGAPQGRGLRAHGLGRPLGARTYPACRSKSEGAGHQGLISRDGARVAVIHATRVTTRPWRPLFQRRDRWPRPRESCSPRWDRRHPAPRRRCTARSGACCAGCADPLLPG